MYKLKASSMVICTIFFFYTKVTEVMSGITFSPRSQVWCLGLRGQGVLHPPKVPWLTAVLGKRHHEKCLAMSPSLLPANLAVSTCRPPKTCSGWNSEPCEGMRAELPWRCELGLWALWRYNRGTARRCELGLWKTEYSSKNERSLVSESNEIDVLGPNNINREKHKQWEEDKLVCFGCLQFLVNNVQVIKIIKTTKGNIQTLSIYSREG